MRQISPPRPTARFSSARHSPPRVKEWRQYRSDVTDQLPRHLGALVEQMRTEILKNESASLGSQINDFCSNTSHDRKAGVHRVPNVYSRPRGDPCVSIK